MRKGSDAEDLAADYLLAQGYTLVTRRFKARTGEIDLVAMDGAQLVFIEVKARSGPWQKPEESLSDQKRKHLYSAAEEYMTKFGITGEVRFDFVGIDEDGLRHVKDAFAD